MQVFSTRNPHKVKQEEEALSVPRFSSPWKNEESVVEIDMQEELPVGQNVLCIPARNLLDGSIIQNVEVTGNDAGFFHLDTQTGLLF